MMWLLQALSSGFSREVSDWRLEVYRILLAVALLLKTFGTAFLGDWNRFRPGSFGRYEVAALRSPRQVTWQIRLHKPLIVARGVGGLLLLVGFNPRVAILLILAGLLHELTYEYRFNTMYLCLCLLCLLPAGRLGHGFHFSDRQSSANTWSQFLVVLVTVDLYWNSAYQKVRSRQFITGLSLAQLTFVADRVRTRLPHWEYWHPQVIARQAAVTSDARWRILAIGVVALEAMLPAGLVIPGTWLIAVACGCALHAAFLGILPLRLAPFTLATVASYLLFQP